jgi:hypothetical protein
LFSYDYEASDYGYLSFNEGDTIYVVERDDSGTWKGICKGRKGLFKELYAMPKKVINLLFAGALLTNMDL